MLRSELKIARVERKDCEARLEKTNNELVSAETRVDRLRSELSQKGSNNIQLVPTTNASPAHAPTPPPVVNNTVRFITAQ